MSRMHSLIVPPMLSYADPTDNSGSGLVVVLLCLAVTVAAAGLALLPIGLARTRRHLQSEAIVGFAILWALALAGSVVIASMADMKWSKERDMRIKSGYYDPRDNTDAPAKPWAFWGGLGVVYTGLVGWSMAQQNAEPRAE